MPIPPRRVGVRAILSSLPIALLLTGCDLSTEPMELRPSLSGGTQVAGCSLVQLGLLWDVDDRWTCTAPAVEVGSPLDLRDAVIEAARAWNTAMGHSPDGYSASPWAPQFPRLIPVPSTSGDLVVVWAGSGAVMCGGTDPESDVITLTRTSAVGTTACPTNVTADPAVLLVHELGHALGFTADSHKPSYGVAAGCTMNLESIRPAITDQICQHEIEYLLAGYNYRQIDPGAFWNRPIVTRLVGPPAADTVVQNASITVSVTQLAFDRQPGGSVPIGGTVVAWEPDDDGIATATPLTSSSASIVGVQPDSTTLRARTGSGLPSSYLLSTRLLALGEPTRILVTPAPPGPFKVTDIVGPPTPITAAGNRTFQATVINPPAGTLQVRWVAIASNAVFDSLDTGYGPNSFTLYVEEGAYNIRVKAYPRVVPVSGSPTYGAHAIEDYPVCTGGGGDNLWGGGGSPDAEEGC